MNEQKSYSNGFSYNVPLDGSGQIDQYRRETDYRLLEIYESNAIAYTCIEKNSTQVAQTKWGIYKTVPAKSATKTFLQSSKAKTVSRKKQKCLMNRKAGNLPADSELIELTSHPFIDALSDGTDGINGYQLFKITDTWLEIFGRAYWLKPNAVDLDGNEISNTGVLPLKPWRVRPVLNENGFIASYEYQETVDNQGIGAIAVKVKSRTVYFAESEVIPFRFIHPAHPFSSGIGPLMAAMMAVNTCDLYTNWLHTTMKNRRRADYVFIPKDGATVSDDDIKRAEDELNKKLAGSNNGKPIFLKGNFTAVCLSYSPTDLAPLEVQKEYLKRIAGVHGIPSAIADSDAATYSNYESAMEDWARSAIAPRCAVIDQGINDNAEKLGVDDGAVFSFDNPVPEDEEFELEQRKVAVTVVQFAGGVLSTNEKRELLGYESTGNPEDDKVAPTPAAPAIGQKAPDNQVTETPADDGEQPSDDASSQESEGKAATLEQVLKINGMVAGGSLPRAVAINLVAEVLGYDDERAKQLVGHPVISKTAAPACGCGNCQTKAKQPAEEQPLEDKMVAVVKNYFKKLKPKVLGRLKGFDLTGYITKDKLPDEFVPLPEWTDDLANAVKPLIELGIKTAADGKQTKYINAGASPDAFDVMPQKIEDAVDNRAFKFANSTIQTTAKTINDAIAAIREQVLDGVGNGDTNAQMADAVNQIFENAQEYQAERIARTEASAAVHNGQVIAAKESGIVSGFSYLVSSDACPVCQAFADQEIKIGDYDTSGAVDADGAVPLHPNCTCTLEEIIDLGGDDSRENNE